MSALLQVARLVFLNFCFATGYRCRIKVGGDLILTKAKSSIYSTRPKLHY